MISSISYSIFHQNFSFGKNEPSEFVNLMKILIILNINNTKSTKEDLVQLSCLRISHNQDCLQI